MNDTGHGEGGRVAPRPSPESSLDSSLDSSLGGLSRPIVGPEQAALVAAEHWGLEGRLTELGSNQDYNALIETAEGRFVLKVANSAWEPAALQAQHDALRLLRGAGMVVPVPVGAIEKISVGDQQLLAHVLTYVDGTPLLDRGSLEVDDCRRLGATAGKLVAALAGFRHPGADRRSQWDLRRGVGVVDHLAPALRPRLGDAIARLAALADELPIQVVHGDLTDDNVVLTPDGEVGVIDFGDLGSSWRCAELAVAAASVLAKTGSDVDALLAVVAGFTAHVPLSDAELAAVWPLVVLRGGVLVASATDLISLEDDHPYAQARAGAERAGLEASLALDLDEMTWLIRGVGQPLAPLALPRLLPAARPFPLDVTSPLWDDGAWLAGAADLPALIAREGVETSAANADATEEPVATRYGEYRLDRAAVRCPRGSSKVFALGVEVRLPIGTVLPALPPSVIVDGVDADGVTTREAVWLQACALPGRPPRFVTARAEDVWRRICPDPSPLFGVDLAAPVPDPEGLLARRAAHYATVQEHYYAAPPQIERGWREFLIDTKAAVYVDGVNNVTTTGHAHPALTRAASRQWALLNTNSRFHYAAHVELAERLAALAPDGLDQVFLVNSGSEAVDLALRLAMTATGRGRILAAREAYHGWTIGADAVTSSIGDNPRALETRPGWVELIDAPNQVRGTHRGAEAGPAYLADLDIQLSRLDTAQIAGVILEPIFGNGGGVLLPDGYLAGVFARVRALGGLCISDEVQVGYGRLGRHFWGFEQQGAVPDIITIAKAMGNGQPLGAVITTRAIAEAFAAEGSLFSSAGGSPVSAAVGLAVLDVMDAERLQDNATEVGSHLRDGLARLAGEYDAIGAVHGMGLYLGVELVTERRTFAPATDLARDVCEGLLELGCLVQPTGDQHNVLKIKPPLVLTRQSADHLVAALGTVLDRVSRRC